MLGTLALVCFLAACTDRSETAADRSAVAEEMEKALQNTLLQAWYPQAIDRECGGFLTDFNHRMEPDGPADKFLVHQARHVWTTAEAARFYPEEDSLYLSLADHGFTFLRDRMWDEEHGGFFSDVDCEGPVPTNSSGEFLKRAYGQSFAIYGLATYYEASGNKEALQLAQDAFRWLDAHAHDPEHGGYFQFISRDGEPYREGYEGTPPKDQNSTLHLIEAFTELYKVWPDPVLEDRLHELLRIMRDTLVVDRQYLTLFAQADWTPVSYRDSSEAVREANYNLDHVSFGHDIEAAYLMLEASEALGLENDTTTLRTAKSMADHTLRNGWDRGTGGIYDAGYYPNEEGPITIIEETKNWWAQAEALNTLLLMADRFPEDEMQYYDRFQTQWGYIKENLIDWEHGGWYAGGIDKQPDVKTAPKGHRWKAAYHETRSLMNCIQRLRGEDNASSADAQL